MSNHSLQDSCRLPETSTPVLSINHKQAKKQPLGVNYIDRMMKTVVQGTSVTGRKTNHSARKTVVETLCQANIPDSSVMQLSGHKNVQSLNHYKKPYWEQQKSKQSLLNKWASGTLTLIIQHQIHHHHHKTKSAAAHIPGPFSNAMFTNSSSVLNFGGPSQQVSYGSSVTSSLSAPVRRKRPLVIHDSSDEDRGHHLPYK